MTNRPESQLALFADPPTPPPLETRRPDEVRAQAERLAARLSRLLGMDVRLAVTDNRSTVISYRRRPGVLVLRLHHMFLHAPVAIIEALAQYAGHGTKGAGPVLDAYIRTHRDRLKSKRRTRPLRSRGLFHDLQAIFDGINAEHFENRIEARIGWGRCAARRNQRSIRMGVYLHDERLIRIHPALDRPEVPGYFVAFVVFHEMLHQAVPASHCGDGRRQHHGADFRRRERAYPAYARAMAWEKANLDMLLGASHGGEAA